MEQCDYIFDRSRRFEPGRLQLIPNGCPFLLVSTIGSEPTPLIDTPHPRLLTGTTPSVVGGKRSESKFRKE